MSGQIHCSCILLGQLNFLQYTLFCVFLIAIVITNICLGRKHVITRLILALDTEICI